MTTSVLVTARARSEEVRPPGEDGLGFDHRNAQRWRSRDRRSQKARFQRSNKSVGEDTTSVTPQLDQPSPGRR